MSKGFHDYFVDKVCNNINNNLNEKLEKIKVKWNEPELTIEDLLDEILTISHVTIASRCDDCYFTLRGIGTFSNCEYCTAKICKMHIFSCSVCTEHVCYLCLEDFERKICYKCWASATDN